MPSAQTQLKIPETWRPHLEGRPGGALDAKALTALLASGEYEYGPNFEQSRRDWLDAPYALVAVYGLEAVEHLKDLVPLGSYVDADVQQAAAEALSAIPTDEAMWALLDRATQQTVLDQPQVAGFERNFQGALLAAIERFPRRAIQILAVAAKERSPDRYGPMLARAVRQFTDVAEALLSSLDAPLQPLVAAAIAEANVPVATADALPAVLATPPWTRPKKKTKKRKALALETPDLTDALVWRPGEQAQWDARGGTWGLGGFKAKDVLALRTRADWDALAEKDAKRFASYGYQSPAQIARKHLRRTVEDAMPKLVAEHGLKALEAALSFAEESPKAGCAMLAPYASPRAAEAIALAFAKHKSTKNACERWLRRHAELAATVLIPQALGKDRSKATRATRALAFLIGPRREVVLAVANSYGKDVPEALLALFAGDPLLKLPRKIPKLPDFWRAGAAEAPRLKSGEALPASALDDFVTMLAFSKAGDVYAGVREVQAACEPSSIARFSWSLFEAWLAGGYPPKHKWAFYQLGWLGDDDIAYRLVKLMEEWPRQGKAKRAELGLDVLAEMERDVALVLVSRLAQKSRSRSLKKNAKKKIAEIAERLDISEGELADRLVPTFELDEAGGMDLDFGPRRFRVGFDAELNPLIEDEAGKRRKSLPKAAKNDDPELAAAAATKFKLLKKNVRLVVRSEIARLERAMCTGRRWSLEAFQRYLVAHPLMIHLVRRLVWAEQLGAVRGRLFRVGDRELRALDGSELALEEDAEVTLVHRAELSEDEAYDWLEVMRGEKRLPPFDQLDRTFFVSEDRAALTAEMIDDEVPAGALLGLTSKGWERSEVGDGGMIDRMVRRVDGYRVVLTFEPGLAAGMIAEEGSQALDELFVLDGNIEASVDALSAVAFSELMLDLSRLS